MVWLQKTVAEAVSQTGIGLHTGQQTHMRLVPAPINTGIVFRVTNGDGRTEIPARVEYVPVDGTSGRNTTLARDGVEIHTVEHLLAALSGVGVTNCYIEIDGAEPPVSACGSALPYLELIDQAGLREQGVPATYYKIGEPIHFQSGDVEITVEPDEEFRLSFEIDYDDPLIGHQEQSFTVEPGAFRREIAAARTFVMREDIARLRELGLAQGGSLDNALVVDNGRLMAGQELRWPDEFVRHKILDLLGDVSLLGMPIKGHIHARRSGHEGNVAVTRMLARKERKMARIYPQREPESWDIASIMDIMPHRYPFLLVDRILELEPSKRVVGIKNVTINEPFFQGHFPGHPIMPAVLIIEAMAQTGGVLLLNSVEDCAGKLVYFSGIDQARFRQPVIPGDQLRFELEMVKLRGSVCKMRGVAYVGEMKVAEADLMSSIVDR